MKRNAPYTFARAVYHSLLDSLPGTLPDRIHFLKCNGYLPSISHPRSFNEKVLHRKLTADPSAFSVFADKISVKEYVRNVAGEQFVTPTLWMGHTLPTSPAWPLPFVIKSSYGSGNNIFVESQRADWKKIRKITESWKRRRWARHLREDWYNQIDRRILVEPFIGGGDAPVDYKLFVFSGRVRIIQVDTDRFFYHRRTLFNTSWERLDFSFKFDIDTRDIERPLHLDEMISIAEALGSAFDFVRIDLYDLPQGPRFGEMTFAPESGFGQFRPRLWDYKLGSYWTTPRPLVGPEPAA